ncbi:glycogen synthase [Candidatus Parcubacteria bacterium]|nr:MAG: glycogen synthase [Candidatus Parcubacteria bacterium]
MKKKLKIVHIASEVDPFSKTGGLADVTRSLPKALKETDKTEIIVITPLYSEITDVNKFGLKKIIEDIKIEMSDGINIESDYWQGELAPGLQIYFIDNNKYFGKRKTLYGSDHENARFFFFDLAALKLLKLINFQPDIVHCHDWQTGLVPYFLKRRFSKDEILGNAASIFTIHNLLFQLGQNWWKIKNDFRDDGYSRLPKFEHSDKLESINFAKRAIINADIINAVSEKYAEEILTKDFGEDLHRILKNRENRVFGIINGIDYDDYNPKTDPGLQKNYDATSLDNKLENKKFLQKYFGLPQEPEVPILGMVTRITEQKGIDLIMEIMDSLLKLDLQFVIMGAGEKHYENFFKKIQKKYPKKIGVHLEFDPGKATSIYAGSDMFLMPSRFEPCGLGQLISLRYGSVPIVRSVGGLADTITDFNPRKKKGDGFIFHSYTSQSLLIAIVRAIETFKYRDIWQNLVKEGMQKSLSWEMPAKKYLQLYRKAIKHKKENNK